MQALNKSIGIAYITSKIALKNLEVAIHELSLINDDNKGKIQHRTEKLINAHKNMFGTIEGNLDKTNLKELESHINQIVDELW